ncbi:hypothetical protein G6L37_04015 [Agrobacterium rubi]|nr:hypothetical protein [Agrobacterium rubi]NTF24516.1 hypothetical protein [Agrobacterium rubi]
MGESALNVLYRSATRICVEEQGIVVHVENGASFWIEARETASGGPRSGRVVGRLIGSGWDVEPETETVRGLMERARQLTCERAY